MFLERSQACNFIKKKTLAQVFSCEFCDFSKNTYFYRTPLVAASASAQQTMNSRLAVINLRNMLITRGYKEQEINEGIERTRTLDRQKLLEEKT